MIVTVVLLVTIAVGGGASLAAEQALPGDALYPIKIQMNENARSVLAFSQEAKAEWKVEQIGRRLQEAETLAVKGKLRSNQAVTLEKKFDQYTRHIDNAAARLEAQGNAEAAAEVHSNLEAMLSAHEKILDRVRGVQSELNENNEEVREFVAKVKVRAREAREARVEAEKRISAEGRPNVKEAAQGKQKAAAHKIAEVKSYLERKKAGVGVDAVANAESKLHSAETLMGEGEAKLQANAYGEAFSIFQQATRVAQEAKAFLQVSADLDVDIDLQGERVEERKSREEREQRNNEEKNLEGEVEVEAEGDGEKGGSKAKGKVNIEANVEIEL